MICHCGQPLHYTNQRLKALVYAIIEKKGEYVKVTWHQRSWWVSRHFIALHGIKGKDLSRLHLTEALDAEA